MLYCYVLFTVGESGNFLNTVCITVPNTFLLLIENFENSVSLLVIFVIFGLLFCMLFKNVLLLLGQGGKLFFCLRFFDMQKSVCNMCCREFEASF